MQWMVCFSVNSVAGLSGENDKGEEMDSSHEMIIPNDNLPFKLFLFEGGEGKYKRASHWHRSIEIFLVMKGEIDFYLGERHFSIGERILLL